MKSSLVLAAVLLLADAGEASGQKRGYQTEPALAAGIYGSLVATALLDAHSTREALTRNPQAFESRAYLSGCARSAKCLVSFKAASAIGIGLIADQAIGRSRVRPWLRYTLQIGVAATSSFYQYKVAASNYRIASAGS